MTEREYHIGSNGDVRRATFIGKLLGWQFPGTSIQDVNENPR